MTVPFQSISSINLVFAIKSIDDVKQLSASYITYCNSTHSVDLFYLSAHKTEHSIWNTTYMVSAARKSQLQFWAVMKFFKHLSCVFVLNTFWSIMSAFFTLEKHMAVLMNRTYCWRYYLSFWLAHSDGCACVCVNVIYGTGGKYMVVWVRVCEKAKVY